MKLTHDRSITTTITALQDEINMIQCQSRAPHSRKYHYTADTLSRKVANNTMATSTIPEEGMNAHIDSIIAVISASDPKLWGVENV